MVQNRKALFLDTAHKALQLRQSAGIGLLDPVCVYDLVTKLDIDLWFSELPTVEGIYSRGKPPVIVVSSARPPGRQAYTCAHELGHHLYDHGFRVDVFLDQKSEEPIELIADSFAGFLLMPKTTVSFGFTSRGWSVMLPTPIQVYTVASWLGVGYETLVFHMSRVLGLISASHAKELSKINPFELRSELLGRTTDNNLTLVDNGWRGRAIDIEVGDYIHMPANSGFLKVGERACVSMVEQDAGKTVYRGQTPGIGRVFIDGTSWAAFVRVSRRRYVGRAIYRHLEDPDHD